MKVLVIGGGGREHALAWKLAQSERTTAVYVAPGNAGTTKEPRVQNIAIAAGDIAGLLRFAETEAIDLTVVGPEDPLAGGLVNVFEQAGRRILGPRREAARLESSKGFCKDFMQRHRIPTARYRRFGDLDAALHYLDTHPVPVVVKADGLAAGKGVVVAMTQTEAKQAATAMLKEQKFKEAGREIVVEECLSGEEASFICLVDGTDVVPLATSQDHKARDEGNQGPNTGGMGAYSPTPCITPGLQQRVVEEIIQPTVNGLAAEGIHYRGFLYAGLMIDAAGNPQVLEFNCRFGDPETQPILMRLQSDFLELCLASTEGCLADYQIAWDPRPALGVVLAIRDYPESYPKGVPIEGLEESEEADVKVFHAGTALQDGQTVTSGGRVLCVCAQGEALADARSRAYQVAERIAFEGKFYRRDIGAAALPTSGSEETT